MKEKELLKGLDSILKEISAMEKVQLDNSEEINSYLKIAKMAIMLSKSEIHVDN